MFLSFKNLFIFLLTSFFFWRAAQASNSCNGEFADEFSGMRVVGETLDADADSNPIVRQIFNEIKKMVIGQDQAIVAVRSPLLRIIARTYAEKGPRGILSFMGPSGVGKTELAKAIIIGAGGKPDQLLRINGNDYASEGAVNRLIGASAGYIGHDSPPVLAAAAIEKSTFEMVGLDEKKERVAFVLFDEFDKAHPSVAKYLLTALDEGYTELATNNQKIDLRHVIFIFSSNAGASQVLTMRRSNQITGDPRTDPKAAEQILDTYQKALLLAYPHEFLGRLGPPIPFYHFGPEEIERITAKELSDLRARYIRRETPKFTFTVSPELALYLSDKGVSDEFGARHLRTLIEKNINGPLSELLVSGGLTSGDVVELSQNDAHQITVKRTHAKLTDDQLIRFSDGLFQGFAQDYAGRAEVRVEAASQATDDAKLSKVVKEKNGLFYKYRREKPGAPWELHSTSRFSNFHREIILH